MPDMTCNNCGWVHFGVTRQYAKDEMANFNKYFDTLTKQQRQDNYGGKKSSIAQYEHCTKCGNPYNDFRVSKEDDCPMGVTTGPIIYE